MRSCTISLKESVGKMISVPLCDLSGLCGERFLEQFHHRDTENLHRGTEKNLLRQTPEARCE